MCVCCTVKHLAKCLLSVSDMLNVPLPLSSVCGCVCVGVYVCVCVGGWVHVCVRFLLTIL